MIAAVDSYITWKKPAFNDQHLPRQCHNLLLPHVSWILAPTGNKALLIDVQTTFLSSIQLVYMVDYY